MKSIRTVRPSWDAGAIVVCRECDGYSKLLRRALKDALAEAGLREHVRVVEGSCMDVCPKRATTVLVATPRRSEAFLIPEGVDDAASFASLVGRFRGEPTDSIE